jgi:hypothetical protein
MYEEVVHAIILPGCTAADAILMESATIEPDIIPPLHHAFTAYNSFLGLRHDLTTTSSHFISHQKVVVADLRDLTLLVSFPALLSINPALKRSNLRTTQ